MLKDSTGERLADPEQHFQHFFGLNTADDAGGGTDDAGLFAGLRRVGFRWFDKEAAKAGTVRQNRENLAAPLQHRTMDERFPEDDSGVVQEKLGLEVIGAVDHKVVPLEDLYDVG